MVSAVKTDDAQKFNELREFITTIKEEKEYPNSYLIAVLHKAQELFRYLRKDVINEVAILTDTPVSTVWGVATFYHYFNLEPRGDYVISVCLGTACYVKGAEKVLETLKHELKVDTGETTEDMKFTLLTTRCLGTCALSPVMMINGKVYSQLTSKKVTSIIHKLQQADTTKE
jgi:NADH:ubiquinone oxidoreductase subunit E